MTSYPVIPEADHHLLHADQHARVPASIVADDSKAFHHGTYADRPAPVVEQEAKP